MGSRLAAHRLGPSIACWRVVTQTALPRWALIAAVAIVVISLVAFALGLIVGYIADEYMTPAFSEQSVPPPRAY